MCRIFITLATAIAFIERLPRLGYGGGKNPLNNNENVAFFKLCKLIVSFFLTQAFAAICPFKQTLSHRWEVGVCVSMCVRVFVTMYVLNDGSSVEVFGHRLFSPSFI